MLGRPKYTSLGQPVIIQGSSSSESSSSEDFVGAGTGAGGDTVYDRNKQYLRQQQQQQQQQQAPTGNNTNYSSSVDQHVKNVLGVQFPLKSQTSTAALPLKQDTISTCPLGCDKCDKCREKRKQQLQMPAMTNAPVEQRFMPTGTRGIQTALPTSKLVSLTAPPPQARPLIPLTKEDYSLAQQQFNAQLSLGHKHCGVKGHQHKDKTSPRVLAPFNLLNGGATATAPLTPQDRATFSLDAQTAQRLGTTFDMHAQLQRQSPGLASLLKTGHATNLACPSGSCGQVNNGGEQCGDALVREIKCHHPEFFALLQANNLVDHLLYPQLLVVIPNREALQALPQTRDEATGALLRYHLVKGGGTRFQDVRGVQQFATWTDDAKQVQVEQHEDYGGFHTINGKQLIRSDPNFRDVIFHVRGGTLRPEDVMLIAEPAQPDGDEAELTTESLATRQLRLCTAKEGETTFSNKALQATVSTMNRPFYAANISLGAQASIKNDALDRCHGVDIALSVYNTQQLFADYRAKAMNTVARVASAQLHRMHFPAHGDAQTHVDYGTGAQYVEYAVTPTSTARNGGSQTSPTVISRADLLDGLVGLSFSSPYEGGSGAGNTVALCRLTASAQDSNVFMSSDENVMLRFKGPHLHLISINHKALNTATGAAIQKEHFIELAPALVEKAFYSTVLHKSAFDDLLLTHASLKKLVKKAKRVAGKAASKTKRLSDKVSSSALHRVPSSALLTPQFEEAVDGAEGGTPETMKVLQYDKSHRVRTSSQSSQVYLQKSDATVGKESVLVYRPDSADNRVAADWGTGGLVKYVDVTLSDRNKLSLDVTKMPLDKSIALFYATSGRDLLVFRFDQAGSLVALYSINKSYDLARRLIQARHK